MRSSLQRAARSATLLAVLVVPRTGHTLAAQDPAQVLNLGAPVGDTLKGATPDSLLARTILRFNDPATTRFEGKLDLAPGATMNGTLALYGNLARIQGTVRGSIIILNGDLRVSAAGRVEGSITVLGGRLTVAPGGVITGDTTVYARGVPVQRAPDGTVIQRKPGRALADYTSASASFALGPVLTTMRVSAGAYNRNEGLPIEVGPTFKWRADDRHAVDLGLTGILRTASAGTDARSDFGWSGRLAVQRNGARPLTVGLDAGSVIAPMISQAYSPLESGLSAFLLRRDYRDWYASKGWGVFADWAPFDKLTLSGRIQQTRESSVRSTGAFSLFRNDEAWRANPLVDDGRFQTVALGLGYDTRDDRRRTTSGWWVRAEVRRVTSDELTPGTLPAEIRDPLPASGYGATEVDFDARYYLRLNPKNGIHLRAAGGGWLGGDPQLMQHRRALGGRDPLSGYGFRFLNCDRRLRRDAALPALCDRELLLQAEYRRTLDLNFSTRLGGYALGIQRADFVVFGDLGSAWLAGDGKGQVPTNRIQAIGEWRSDVGVGFATSLIGVYIAKAIADPEPVRLLIRLQPRF